MEGVGRLLAKHQRQIIPYGTLALFLFFVYHLVSDQDFSFLLTVGAMLKLFGFGLVLYTVATTGSAEGVSSKTLQAYLIVFCARLASVLSHPGYLPYDSSGDWFYQLVLVALVAVLGLTLALIHTRLGTSYEASMDSLATGGSMSVPSWATVPLLAGPAALLAMIIHPSLNSSFVLDSLWTFALYLEAVAVGPQLWMFHMRNKRGNDLAKFTAHMVFSLGVGAVLHLLFWLSSHDELNTNALFSNGTVGYLTVLACIVQVGLMGDFLFLYLKAWQSGQQMVLPSGGGV